MERPVRVAVLSGDDDVSLLVETIVGLDARFAVHSRTTGTAPDLVIVDVGDRELEGMRTLRRVRAWLPAARVVAFSPVPDPVTLLEILRDGVDAYLGAPDLWRELVPTLHAVCGLGEDFGDDGDSGPLALSKDGPRRDAVGHAAADD